jgi:sugar/nucleoside kinase (ribokinase family)
MAAKILGMGNALVDIMTRLKDDQILEQMNLPKGTMQLVNREFIWQILDKTVSLTKSLSSGGSAANTIHGLANLGIETAFIGKVGSDEFGEIFKKDLLLKKINPLIFYGLNETGRAVALVSPDSERTFATFLGAAVELSEDDIDSSIFKGYNYFHIEGYLVQNHHLIEKAVRLAKKNDLLVSLDMASFNVVDANRDFLASIIEEYVDIVFANEEEAKAFTGLDPEEAVKSMSKDCSIAIVKLGERGSFIQQKNVRYAVPSIKANCIDTTGAGDLYASGFLFGLTKNFDLEKCGHLGSLLAGNVIEVIGAKMDENRWKTIHYEIAKINQDPKQ